MTKARRARGWPATPAEFYRYRTASAACRSGSAQLVELLVHFRFDLRLQDPEHEGKVDLYTDVGVGYGDKATGTLGHAAWGLEDDAVAFPAPVEFDLVLQARGDGLRAPLGLVFGQGVGAAQVDRRHVGILQMPACPCQSIKAAHDPEAAGCVPRSRDLPRRQGEEL